MIHPAYIAELCQSTLLTAAEERALAWRVKAGDALARDELIGANLRLVVRIARGFTHLGRRVGLDSDDLIGHGNVGLVNAADRFDPAEGCRFSTYAIHWISMRIRRAIVDQAAPVRVPSHLHPRLPEYRAKVAAALAAGKPPPDDPSLAAADWTLSRAIVRLDYPIYLAVKVSSLHEVIPDPRSAGPEPDEGEGEDGRRLDAALETLPAADRDLIRRRYGLDGEPETFYTIARALGTDPVRVRQYHDRALRLLGLALGVVRPAPTGIRGVREYGPREFRAFCSARGGAEVLGPVRRTVAVAARDWRRLDRDRRTRQAHDRRAAALSSPIPEAPPCA